MAIVYIDPNADAGGDGSTSATSSGDNTHALQALPSLDGVGGGHTYSCKGGETSVLTDRIQIKDVSDVTINSYETGQHIFDGTAQAVNYSGNIWVQTGTTNITIDNVTVTSTADDGISNSSAIVIEGTATNTLITNVTLTSNGLRDHEHAAIVARPSGNYEISNFHITGFTRGITNYHNNATGLAPEGLSSIHHGYIKVDGDASFGEHISGMRFNSVIGIPTDYNYRMRVHNIEIEGYKATGITLGAASNVIFENIYIHGYNPDTIYGYSAGFNCGTPTVTPASSGCIIRNCLIVGNGLTPLSDHGISSRNNTDTLVYNNIIVNMDHGIRNAETNSNNNSYYNNTFIDCDVGIENADSTTGTIFKNNIVTGATIPIYEESGEVTYANNCFNISWDASDSYYLLIDAGNPNNIIVDSDTGNEIIDIGNPTVMSGNIIADPQLDDDYKPLGNSPCIGAGIQPLSLLDYNGDTRKSNAGFDIGAVWFDGPMDSTKTKRLASGKILKK